MTDLKNFAYRVLADIGRSHAANTAMIAQFEGALVSQRKHSAAYNRYRFYLSCHAARQRLRPTTLKRLCRAVTTGDQDAAAELGALLANAGIVFAWDC